MNIRNVYALLLIVIGWVIFRAETIPQIGEILRAMFGGYGMGGANIPLPMVLQESEAGLLFFVTLVFAVILSMPVSRFSKAKLSVYKVGPALMDAAVFALLLCAAELSLGSYNPFIYFQF